MRGASKGEGLGNQFLGHIREVDAVAYVLRCFEDGDITHVEGRIDPLADAEMVETELMLADLDSLEKRSRQLEKKAKTGDKEAKLQVALMDKALVLLREGKPARLAELTAEEEPQLRRAAAPHRQAGALRLQRRRGVGRRRQRLLAARSRSGPAPRAPAASSSRPRSRPSSQACPPATAHEFLKDLGLEEPGLNRLIRDGYQLLDLVTYFTVGPKEARAWTITRGTKAPQAAGVIHTDFEKGFIRAETIGYDDYVSLAARPAPRTRARCGWKARSTSSRTAT